MNLTSAQVQILHRTYYYEALVPHRTKLAMALEFHNRRNQSIVDSQHRIYEMRLHMILWRIYGLSMRLRLMLLSDML